MSAVIFDPWNDEQTREGEDGSPEVLRSVTHRWVPACSCGPHVDCPEHYTNCSVRETAT